MCSTSDAIPSLDEPAIPVAMPCIQLEPAGGMGNLFFQYAAGTGIALSRSSDLCIRAVANTRIHEAFFIPSYMDGPFPVCVCNSTASARAVLKEGCNLGFSSFLMGSSPDTAQPDAESIVLSYPTYLQSWRYFSSRATMHQLRRTLRWKADHLALAREHLANATDGELFASPRQTTIIGVHVRHLGRGHSNKQVTATNAYFAAAMEYMRRRAQPRPVRFVVSSDEPTWAQAQPALKAADTTILPDISVGPGSSGKYTPTMATAVSMALLSQCDHLIMSIGTFSWWAAFLTSMYSRGASEIVYLHDEFKPGYVAAINRKWNFSAEEDYFPSSWIAFNTSGHRVPRSLAHDATSDSERVHGRDRFHEHMSSDVEG